MHSELKTIGDMNAVKIYSTILFIVLISIGGYFKTYAQNNIEILTTPEALEVEASIFKPLDSAYKFSVFNLNQADYNYNTKQTTFMTYAIVSYDAYKGFGPTVGARLIRNEFLNKAVALGGVQYTMANEKFFMTTVFTSEFRSKPDFEFFVTTQYMPKLTEKFVGYFEFQTSFNFNTSAHLFSFQKFRLGGYFKKFQAGFSLDNYQFGKNWEFDFQPGVFLQLTI